MKRFMAGNVNLLYIGMRLEKALGGVARSRGEGEDCASKVVDCVEPTEELL